MQHKCKVTVLRRECYADLQGQYLADPHAGPCDFYREGQEFWFERYAGRDDFWRMGQGAHCSEAWDCISRYIYAALQGGSVMRGWTNDERVMIACCSDGTRPVIFRIERVDYKAVYLEGACGTDALAALDGVDGVRYDERGFYEVLLRRGVDDALIARAASSAGGRVLRID